MKIKKIKNKFSRALFQWWGGDANQLFFLFGQIRTEYVFSKLLFEFFTAFYVQFLRIYWLSKIDSWAAKLLLSHAFAVKYRVLKHTSHKMNLTYCTAIF